MEQLKNELKLLIINSLKLEEVNPVDIQDETPLVQEGLGLDSVDILELTVAIERRYRLSIPDEATGKKAFASLNALAEFVSERRGDRSIES
jgi:acyl carrier protein